MPGDTKTLKVLSYNINGLPFPLKARKKPLFIYIREELKKREIIGRAPDIILIQEAFTKKAYKHLISQLDYPYVLKGNISKTPSKERLEKCKEEGIRPKKCYSNKLLNSGLYVLSKYPILNWDRVNFGSSCSGFDCFSNKAGIYLEVDGGKFGNIDIFTTHMNASGKAIGGKRKMIAAKIEQIEKVEAFYQKNRKPKNPMVFAGDVNLHPNKELYDEFQSAIESINAGEYCLSVNNCEIHPRTETEEIFEWTNDQHFIQNGKSKSISPVYLERGFRDPVQDDKKGRLPSDHYSYEVHYKIK